MRTCRLRRSREEAAMQAVQLLTVFWIVGIANVWSLWSLWSGSITSGVKPCVSQLPHSTNRSTANAKTRSVPVFFPPSTKALSVVQRQCCSANFTDNGGIQSPEAEEEPNFPSQTRAAAMDLCLETSYFQNNRTLRLSQSNSRLLQPYGR